MSLNAGASPITHDAPEPQRSSGSSPRSAVALTGLREKIARGQRLTRADGLLLYEQVDLPQLGAWARHSAIARSGEGVFTNVNCHINLTNVCKASCAYCGFSRKLGDADAYALTAEEIAGRASAARAQGVTEFHLVGGLHPSLPLSYFLDAFRLLRSEVPDASIKAFTAVEIDFYAERDGRTVEAVLGDLAAAGVAAITGGGAEIFAPHVRRRVVGHNVTWERWAAVHREAHRIGMRTSSTMLYGHIESAADRVDHVLRLRELQDETGGFDVFVPLRFQPQARMADRPAPGDEEALRVFAASRLLLDNVPHVKVFSVMHGPTLSQQALDHGADDLEGTIADYQITTDLTGAAECGAPAADVIRAEFATLVGAAGRTAVERDTAYNARAATGRQTPPAAPRPVLTEVA